MGELSSHALGGSTPSRVHQELINLIDGRRWEVFAGLFDRQCHRLSPQQIASVTAALVCSEAPTPLCTALAPHLDRSIPHLDRGLSEFREKGRSLASERSFQKLTLAIPHINAIDEVLLSADVLAPFLEGVHEGLGGDLGVISATISHRAPDLARKLLTLYAENRATPGISEEMLSQSESGVTIVRSRDRRWPGETNQREDSLLHHAVRAELPELLEPIVVDGKVSVERVGASDLTPLQLAVRLQQPVAVAELRRLGADPRAPIENGMCAFAELWAERGLPRCLEFIEQCARAGALSQSERERALVLRNRHTEGDEAALLDGSLTSLPGTVAAELRRLSCITGYPDLRSLRALLNEFSSCSEAELAHLSSSARSPLASLLRIRGLDGIRRLIESGCPLLDQDNIGGDLSRSAALSDDRELLTLLAQAGAPLWKRSLDAPSALSIMVLSGATEFAVRILRACGKDMGARLPPRRHFDEEIELARWADREPAHRRTSFSRQQERLDSREFGRQQHPLLDHPNFLYRLRQLLLFTRGIELPTEPRSAHGVSRTLPFFFHEAGELAAQALCTRNDQGQNKFEAERLLLLNPSPGSDPALHVEQSIPLVDRITEQYRYTALGITSIVGDRLNVWARLGVLTFSFRLWRFDCQRKLFDEHGQPEALIERFGFKALPKRVTDDTPLSSGHPGYGPGFVLRPNCMRPFTVPGVRGFDGAALVYDPQTHIEYRRAYLLISHPQHGTLIIRNSSPEFGREALPYPALYSSVAVGSSSTTADLESLNEQDIRNLFQPALKGKLNGAQQRRDATDILPALAALLRQQQAVQERYRMWKFDTNRVSAWQPAVDQAAPEFVGGYYSPGFSGLVELLENLHGARHSGVVVPNLAFVPPHLPPWAEYRFRDTRGELRRRLKITPAVLRALRGLWLGTARDSELRLTTVRAFMQQAGIETEGELVLLTPDT